jgi:hypothetical protein
MILVRQVFQTPVGKSKEVAAMIMQSAADFGQHVGATLHGRVLTDITGPFGTVVLEVEVESLAEWERVQAAMAADAHAQQSSEAAPSPFTGGYQDFYTLEGSF